MTKETVLNQQSSSEMPSQLVGSIKRCTSASPEPSNKRAKLQEDDCHPPATASVNPVPKATLLGPTGPPTEDSWATDDKAWEENPSHKPTWIERFRTQPEAVHKDDGSRDSERKEQERESAEQQRAAWQEALKERDTEWKQTTITAWSGPSYCETCHPENFEQPLSDVDSGYEWSDGGGNDGQSYAVALQNPTSGIDSDQDSGRETED